MSQTAFKIRQYYNLFRLGCHLLYFLSSLTFMLTMIVTGQWMMGAIIFSTLFAIHSIAVWLVGWGSSVVFFVVFVLLTFSFAKFNVRGEQIGAYVVSHPALGDYKYGKDYDNLLIAGTFKDDLYHKWVTSDDYTWWQNTKGLDPDKAFTACWDNFEVWVSNGAQGEAPIPTVKFLFHYTEDHQDQCKPDEPTH